MVSTSGAGARFSAAHVCGFAARLHRTQRKGREVIPMKKITVRKAGPVKLTLAPCYCIF